MRSIYCGRTGLLTGLVLVLASVGWTNNVNTGGQKGVSRTVSTEQFGQGTYFLGASVHGAYAYEGIEYTDAQGVFQQDSPTLLSEDVFFGLGLTNWADFSMDLPVYQDFWSDYGNTAGIGDVSVGLKLAHVGLDKNAPFRVAYLGRFSFPTGSENTGYVLRHSYYSYRDTVQFGKHPYGAGGVRFQPQMVWTLDFSKFPGRRPWLLHANVGPNVYLATKKQAYQGSSAALVGSMALEYNPGERYSYYTELSGDLLFAHLEEGANPFTDLNKNNLLFTVGMARRTQSGLRVDLGLDAGLSDADERIQLRTTTDAGRNQSYTIAGSPLVGARLTVSFERRGEKARYALGRFFGSPDDTVKIVRYDTVQVVKNDTLVVVRRDTVQTQVRDTIRIRDTQERQAIIQYGVVVYRNLNFRVGSASLLPSSYPVLDDVAASLLKYPEVKIEIRGYTDVSGNAEKNLLLSQQRAQSVVDYLVSRQVPADRLKATGLGNSEPIADNSTSEGRVLNRRVEIKRVDSFEPEQAQ